MWIQNIIKSLILLYWLYNTFNWFWMNIKNIIKTSNPKPQKMTTSNDFISKNKLF